MGNDTKENTPMKLDAGSPVGLSQNYFWVWIEMVRLWSERRRAPLNSREDIYPMIGRYYTPKSGSVSRPNPSVYLSCMKGTRGKPGVIRMAHRAGPDYYWAPLVDIVIRVGGKIVFTPADLPALLTHAEQFLLPHERADAVVEERLEPVHTPDAVQAQTPVRNRGGKSPRKPRLREIKNHERFDAFHLWLWESAQPGEEDDRRLLSKITMGSIQSEMEISRGLQNMLRHGRALLVEGDDVHVWIIRPSTAVAEAPPAQVESTVSPPAPDLAHLEETQLRAMRDARLSELEIRDLTREHALLMGQIQRDEGEISSLRQNLAELEENLGRLTTRKEGLEEEMGRQCRVRDEDEQLRLIDWALAHLRELSALGKLIRPRS